MAYELKEDIPLIPTPLVKDNRLYLWTDDGALSCLRLDTGKLVWKERVGGAYYASPVWVNGCIYNVAKNGHVVVLAAADKFEVLGRMSLGELSYATPAVAGGVMYSAHPIPFVFARGRGQVVRFPFAAVVRTRSACPNGE